MEKIIIFGAGYWGDMAYHYYKKHYDIVAYVDNNEALWYSERNGIKILPPSILKDEKVTVVIANSYHEGEIKEQLRIEFGISYALIFRISSESEELDDLPDTEENEIIVSFMGGLGNQMFQYAFYKTLEQNNKKVSGDLTYYVKPGSRDFELMNVFPHTKVEKASGRKVRRYKILAPYMDGIVGQVYFEPNVMDGIKSFADERLLKSTAQYGYFRGYFQTRVFPQMVEKMLQQELAFADIDDEKLKELATTIRKKNAVSVHVRRGDYLQIPEMYGGICTNTYYEKAMDIIRDKVDAPVFCFFSNDIIWVKANYKEREAIYIEASMFNDYHDWYDMYLMSICKHNIIANSSFSWWGAWLNKNFDKIVIAPRKWFNAESMDDICPEEWIRI